MFDDQPTQGGVTPGNLPVSEPEDIFSNPPGIPPEPSEAPTQTALAAGALKARLPEMPPPSVAPPEGVAMSYPTKGPVLSRILIGIILIVVIGGVVGLAAWFVYTRFFAAKSVEPVDRSQTGSLVVTPAPAEPTPLLPPTALPESTPDDELLFGEPIDADGDGLPDVRENELGTDPQNWDTDSDQLSDFDEASIWQTDPKNPDTDGDTYEDGAEVKNGYNPAGPGKFVEPPKP